MGLALQAMWAANIVDIQKTLHQVGSLGQGVRAACWRRRRSRPCTHAGVRGASQSAKPSCPAPAERPLLTGWPRPAAPVQVCKRLLRDPAVPKPEAKARAAALAELGRIFAAARAPPELRKNAEQQLEEAMQKLQEMMGGEGPGGAGGDDDGAR